LTESPTVEYPLILVEGLDVSLYPSIPRLEGQLEGIDVEEGAYRAYDAAGRGLKLEAYGVKRTRRGKWKGIPGGARVTVAEAEPSHVEELRVALARHLKAVGEDVDANSGLGDLVHMCKLHHRYGHTPLRRFSRWRR
jgi:hypothetical protein